MRGGNLPLHHRPTHTRRQSCRRVFAFITFCSSLSIIALSTFRYGAMLHFDWKQGLGLFGYSAHSFGGPETFIHTPEVSHFPKIIQGPTRFPLVRPNGVPGAPPVPLPPNPHETIGVPKSIELRTWAPRLTDENSFPALETYDFDKIYNLTFAALHPPGEPSYSNPPPEELYSTINFSTIDALNAALSRLHIHSNHYNITGSFDWCMANNVPCKSCTISAHRPRRGPLCHPCTHCTAEIGWADGGIRPNPTFIANISGIAEQVFMKFICINDKSVDRFGNPRPYSCPGGKGQPRDQVERTLRRLTSITKVKQRCGNFGNQAVPYLTAPIKTVAPSGAIIDDEIAVLTRRAPGAALASWYGFATSMGPDGTRRLRQMIINLPREQVLLAALHDFVMCENDRHGGNVYIGPDGDKIYLIDNDRELGYKVAYGHEVPSTVDSGTCWPSSIFLPGNVESYRLKNDDSMLYSLDYRCHVNNTGNIPLPDPVRDCLTYFVSQTSESLNEEFGFVQPDYAASLLRRARNILNLGFERALFLEGRAMYETFRVPTVNQTMMGAPGGRGDWLNRKESGWRPWTDAFCPRNHTDISPRWPRWPRPWRTLDAGTIEQRG